VNDDMTLFFFPWRVGRKLGRTIYAQGGSAPSDRDKFIGIFDSADVARLIVAEHNRSRS
jgi:hypothetical protein